MELIFQHLNTVLVTGTLDSGSVTATIAAMGLVDNLDEQIDNFSVHPASAPPRPRGITFQIETSSEWFEVPDTLTIPSPMTFGPLPASEVKDKKAGPNDRQVYIWNLDFSLFGFLICVCVCIV